MFSFEEHHLRNEAKLQIGIAILGFLLAVQASAQTLKPSVRVSLAPEPQFTRLKETILKQDDFVRGEIDSLEFQQKLRALYDQSLAHLKTRPASEIGAWFRDEGEIWWIYFSRLSFDEGTAAALRLSWRERQRGLAALREKVQSEVSAAGDLVPGLSKLDFTVPFDRIILSESKALLPKKYSPLLQRLVSDLQRNPRQSLRDTLKKITPSEKPEFNKLAQIWTDEDAKAWAATKADQENLLALLGASHGK